MSKIEDKQRNLFEEKKLHNVPSQEEILANEFGPLSENVYKMPNSRKHISFLIGVFLVSKKMLERKELQSQKAQELIGRIYNIHINTRERKKNESEKVQPQNENAKNLSYKYRDAKGLEMKYKAMFKDDDV